MPSIREITGLNADVVRVALGYAVRPHVARHREARGSTSRPERNRQLRAYIYQRDRGLCQLGGEPITLEEMTLDRKVPGGPYTRPTSGPHAVPTTGAKAAGCCPASPSVTPSRARTAARPGRTHTMPGGKPA
jgi:hypothetical protein